MIEWLDYRTTGGLLAYPPVGHALVALPHARAGVADAALEGITDENYRWV
ncbi:hypothetical protein ACGFSD_33585 [Streptomyces caniferus]